MSLSETCPSCLPISVMSCLSLSFIYIVAANVYHDDSLNWLPEGMVANIMLKCLGENNLQKIVLESQGGGELW